MSLNLGSASAVINLDASNFINSAKAAGDAMGNLQTQSNSLSNSGGFLNWVENNSTALTQWGKGLMAVGGVITTALAAPIALGSKAVWDQVSAVEQATVALRAYEKDAGKVEEVLGGLIDYARSDMGVLFQREDLFGAAQGLKIMGAETDNLVGYVEIMSRSVGLGRSNWADLERVIGRVGSTGRLTGNDFDMLTAAGYDLDDSLRNTNITWEELFAALDEGIPADALANQSETIRGKTIKLQSALRDLGAAFLGVDKDTSKFIEGGLGDTMVKGLDQLANLLKRAAPAAQAFGRAVAVGAQMASRFVDFVISLPQPVQTAILVITGITGVVLTAVGAFLAFLPVIAPVIAALGSLGGITGVIGAVTGAVTGLKVAMLGLFANPAVLIGIAAIGAGIAAYKTNFLGFGDLVRSVVGWVQDLWTALQMVFGNPITNTATLDVDALLSVPYSQWVEMPDGTYKNADLGLTATGSGLGIVSWVANPDSPDGKDWMLTVDTDGDGKQEALDIINSEDHLDGTYTLTATYTDENGEVKTFTAWYDSATDKTIVLDMDTETAQTNVESLSGRINKMIDWITKATEWATKFGQQFDALMRSDWDNFDWRLMLDLIGLESLTGPIETLIGLYQTLEGAVLGAWEATQRFFGVEGRAEDDPAYDDTQARYNEGQDPSNIRPRHSAVPQEDGSYTIPSTGLAVSPAFVNSYNAGAAAVNNMFGALKLGTPIAKQSAIDNNLMASSVLPVGVNMSTTDVVVKGASAGINSSFAGIAASAATNFSATSATAAAQFGAMATNSAAKFMGMQAQSAVQLALMAGQATTQGNAVNTNLTKGVTAATDSTRSVLARLTGIVSGAGANAAWQAIVAGANIGNSFASGMESALGRIRSAANQMVAAAMVAVAAKAMIASPSKVFMRLGGYVGEGFERGIRNSIPGIANASAAMVNAGVPSPAFNTPLSGGSSTHYIDSSTHTTQYVALTESDFQQLLHKAEAAPSTAIRILKESTEMVTGMT